MDWTHILATLFSSGALVGVLKIYFTINNKVIVLEERVANLIHLLEKIEEKVDSINEKI